MQSSIPVSMLWFEPHSFTQTHARRKIARARRRASTRQHRRAQGYDASTRRLSLALERIEWRAVGQ